MIKNTDYTDYFMYAIGPLAILYFLYETFKEKEEASRKKLIAAFIHPFSIVFWAFYEQSGGSLALFAKTTCVIICCFSKLT
jgi:POT family proton-dependent oligopeptide transporter